MEHHQEEYVKVAELTIDQPTGAAVEGVAEATAAGLNGTHASATVEGPVVDKETAFPFTAVVTKAEEAAPIAVIPTAVLKAG